MKTFNRVFGATLFAGVSALSMSTQALAQAAEDASSNGLDEIIVTARRKEERLEDVPSTVNVATAAELNSLLGISTCPTPRT